jgi:hypothetical protein
MKRNSVLSLRNLQATSLARVTDCNRPAVEAFFTKYSETVEEYKLCPELINNSDESGLSIVHNPHKVFALKGSKQVGSMTSGEIGVTVTNSGCINTLSNSVPLLLIFLVHFKDHMLLGAPHGTSHPSNWSDGDRFPEFLYCFMYHVK